MSAPPSAPPPYSEQDYASSETYPLVKDYPVTGGYQYTQGYPPDAPRQVSCYGGYGVYYDCEQLTFYTTVGKAI